jgi:ParB family chromosome partitioning protein
MHSSDKTRRPALGRGLSALIPTAGNGTASTSVAANVPPGAVPKAQVFQLAIEDIHRDEKQPRRHFDQAKLEELAASIRAKGIIQPVLVRKAGNRPGSYKIIAGERRWRAAQLAGLKEIPAILKEASEHEAFELALVENLQREDLNPIEEAEGYKRLLEDHHLTQEAVAQRVGKDRSTIANALRLLQLPTEIKESLVDGSLNMGHARALLGVADAKQMKQAAHEVMRNKLSVRATEGLVRKLKTEGHGHAKKNAQENRGESPQVRDLVERLQRALGTRCRIQDNGGKGRIEVDFTSYEDLDRLLEKVLGERVKVSHR